MTEDIGFEMDEMQEIIDDFLIEADELIETLDNSFVQLETSPNDLDLLNEIFRAVHTIKGTSSFLGMEKITTVSHKMEDILNKLRKEEMTVSPSLMDVLLDGLDVLKLMLGNVRNKVEENTNIESIVNRLKEAESGCSTKSAAIPTPDSNSQQKTDVSVEASSSELDSTETQVQPLESKPVDTQQQKTTTITNGSPKKSSADQTIRVDVNRLDSLLNMTGELVLGRNSLMQNIGILNRDNEGNHELDRMNQACNAVNSITTELQTAVMKMRMQPIGKVFSRVPRQVRDLARDMNKQIELVVTGESTELDRSVIEEIGDPLMHIIRNSCDHGLEPTDDRIAAGKPTKGTVYLSAEQEGSNIVIVIKDDGRGFDVDAIRDKAVERGLASRQEVDKMPDRDIYSYIFQAGFSTAKVVTDVSGRGVGMDVVSTNIEKLNGLIELNSEKGKGSTVSIKLPLTLAIIQGLLVKSDEDVFIVPLASVYETVRTEHSSISYLNKKPVLRLRDEIIPIINLGGILSADQSGFTLTEKPYIVVVGLAEKKLGLLIDHFLGQEEVVIKSIGSYLGTIDGIAGATILGDGRIRLIVDLIGLFHAANKLA